MPKNFLIILILLFAPVITLEASEPLKVGGDNNYPPYEFIDEKGNPSGFNIELIREVAEVMNLDIQIKLAPWQKVRDSLQNGQIDIITGMYKSPQRDELVDFSTPHLMTSYSVFTRKNSEIRLIIDLQGKELIVQKGDISHDIILQDTNTQNIIEVESPRDAVVLLATGQYDAAIMPYMTGLYFMHKNKITNLKTIDHPIDPKQYCFAVKQGNLKLVMLLNEGLNRLRESGAYDKIYNKWFGMLKQRHRMMHMSKYAKWGLIIVLIGFPLTLFWNWSLKKTVKTKTKMLNRELEVRKKIETKLLEYQNCLQSLSSELILTGEKEKKLVAGHLHDRITQPLVVFKSNLQMLSKSISEPKSKENILKICDSLTKAIEQTQEITCDMCSPVLQELSLEDAIKDYISEKVTPAGIKSKVQGQRIGKEVDMNIKMLLYRDARQLLDNVVKHSNAKNVTVNITKQDSHIHLKVKDDGNGFNYNEIFPPKKGQRSMGLFGIREKIEYFGGSMHVESKVGQGTEITLIKPLKLPDKA